VKKYLLLSLAISFLTLVPHSSGVRASFVDNHSMAAKLLELTNNERRSRGLDSLAENPALTKAAYAKAEDMLNRGYFSHTSPGGKVFYRWVDSAGYEYAAVGENLALNLNMVSGEQMVSSWLDSPTHRENLLSGAYSETGLGVSSGTYEGQPAVFAVQVFAAPKNKKAAAVPPAQRSETVSRPPTLSAESKLEIQNVVKSTAVLGEATSTAIISSEIASQEKYQENFPTITEELGSSALPKDEVLRPKSWLQKILDFFLEN
jgi:uncharacterized protein YkwD